MQRHLGAVVFQLVVRGHDDHLRLQHHPAGLIDPPADVHHEIVHVVGAGPAHVDHKARVLLGHLGPAHGIALEARLVDQRGGIAALGALEGAARGGQIQRLLLPALLVELPHFGGDGGAVALLRAEHRAEDHTARVGLKIAAAVGEGALLRRQLVQGLLRQEVDDHALHHVLQLPAVGAGVHHQAAAHAARDAGGKLQPLQFVLLGEGGQARQAHPALGVDGAVRQQKQLLQLLSADEKQLLQPLVREEDVGAVAQDEGRQLMLFQQIADARQTRHILRHGQGPGRAADAEGAVTRQGLVLQKGQARQRSLDFPDGKFQIFHMILQIPICFLSGHVPDKKHLSALQCASRASARRGLQTR